jgi:AcrR family transcriptional regulator
MTDPKSPSRTDRAHAKRERIVECAMRHFAEDGYQGARVEDVAAELAIAKGSIFQHFGSKAGLFLEAYKRAVGSLPAWLDAPPEILDGGFFATLDFWLERTEHLVKEDWIPYRVSLIGNYGTDLELKRDINRFLVSEDPYGTLEFVEWGQQRGEVRSDVDLETIVSMVDWLSGSLQDALVTQELDPGLFHRWQHQPDRQRMRVEHFAVLLRSAIGLAPRGADA